MSLRVCEFCATFDERSCYFSMSLRTQKSRLFGIFFCLKLSKVQIFLSVFTLGSFCLQNSLFWAKFVVIGVLFQWFHWKIDDKVFKTNRFPKNFAYINAVLSPIYIKKSFLKFSATFHDFMLLFTRSLLLFACHIWPHCLIPI